jgi:ankyrin repeat protein
MKPPESQPITTEAGLFPAANDPMRIEITYQIEGMLPNGAPYPPSVGIYREARPACRGSASVSMSQWGRIFRWEDIVHLAAGGTYAADSWLVPSDENGRRRVRGIVSLCWPFAPGTGLDGRLSSDPVLELQSDLSLAGLDFEQWQDLRFSGRWKFAEWEDPALMLWLVRKWMDETRVDVRGPEMAELLVSAAVENVSDALRKLIRLGADVNALDRNGETALAAAMENAGEFGENGFGYVRAHRMHRYNPKWQIRSLPKEEGESQWIPKAKECVQILREAGAMDYSALIRAATDGDYVQAKHLIDEGFPVGFSISGVGTPLSMAVSHRHAGLVKLFLDAGADPNQPARDTAETLCDPDVTYPFQHALDEPADLTILGLLTRAGARLDVRSERERLQPMIFRCRIGSDEIAKAINSSGLRIEDLRDGHGHNFLHVAYGETLEHILPHVSREMLEHTSFEGFTPLAEAAARGNMAKAAVLLDHGANPNVRCPLSGESESLTGCMVDMHPKFDKEAGRFLIGTPLLQAAINGNYSLVELLLEHDADSNAPNLAVRLPVEAESNRALRAALLTFCNKHAEQIGIMDSMLSHLESPLWRQAFIDAPEPLAEYECRFLPAMWTMDPQVASTLAHIAEEITPAEFSTHCNRPLAALLLKGSSLSPGELLEATCDEMQNVLRPTLEACFGGEEPPHALHVQEDIRKTEVFYKMACEKLGRQPEFDLAEWVIETAEGEFSGGVGRAAKGAKSRDGVEFDDFITALGEHLAPGTNLDDGKLRQAAFAAADTMLRRCKLFLGD